jgi:hypothetical protein
MHHDHRRLAVVVHFDPLDDRVLDPRQHTPYPDARHAVLPALVPSP